MLALSVAILIFGPLSFSLTPKLYISSGQPEINAKFWRSQETLFPELEPLSSCLSHPCFLLFLANKQGNVFSIDVEKKLNMFSVHFHIQVENKGSFQ